MQTKTSAAELFRHFGADKAAFYRCILDVFAAAKRQYRLQLRPDEVLAEAAWPDGPPRVEEVSAALAQLTEWGNLESQPDTARVSSLIDFYRARFLYRLSHGGEAAEAGLALFFQTLSRRAELQTVALEDITSRLLALRQLIDDAAASEAPDVAKMHEVLRDLVRVFEDLAENAQAFMAGVARSIELQQSQANAVIAYKRRLEKRPHGGRLRAFATAVPNARSWRNNCPKSRARSRRRAGDWPPGSRSACRRSEYLTRTPSACS